MKSNHAGRSRMAVAALCGLGLVVGIATFRAQADQWDKKTILTIDQPVQVTNRLLEPGTYVLKLADSQSDRHIVQIFTGDQRHIIDTVLAIPNYRLRPTGKSQFAFWETPPGAAKALRAWFYPGDNFGQEFRYPKNLVMLQTAQAAVTAAPAPEPPQQEAPQVMSQPRASEEEPAEVAQNNPPPPPPVQEAQPEAPVEQPMPENLPKTASPYPAIGLGGLFSFGLYGLLRLKRFGSA